MEKSSKKSDIFMKSNPFFIYIVSYFACNCKENLGFSVADAVGGRPQGYGPWPYPDRPVHHYSPAGRGLIDLGSIAPSGC